MTKDQLKTLAQLPKVIEALRVLAAETEDAFRLMQRVGMVTQAPHLAPMQHQFTSMNPSSATVLGGGPVTKARELTFAEMDAIQSSRREGRTAPPAVAPGHAALVTPEREEYEAARRAGLRLDAPEEALTSGQAARAARAAFLAQAKGQDVRRTSKLEQFSHTNGEAVETVTKMPLETLSTPTEGPA